MIAKELHDKLVTRAAKSINDALKLVLADQSLTDRQKEDAIIEQVLEKNRIIAEWEERYEHRADRGVCQRGQEAERSGEL